MKIIESLMEKEKCVSDICSHIGEEQSKVSHNLRVLQKCHFIERKAEGKRRVYSLNTVTIKPLMKMVETHVRTHCRKACWVKT